MRKLRDLWGRTGGYEGTQVDVKVHENLREKKKNIRKHMWAWENTENMRKHDDYEETGEAWIYGNMRKYGEYEDTWWLWGKRGSMQIREHEETQRTWWNPGRTLGSREEYEKITIKFREHKWTWRNMKGHEALLENMNEHEVTWGYISEHDKILGTVVINNTKEHQRTLSVIGEHEGAQGNMRRNNIRGPGNMRANEDLTRMKKKNDEHDKIIFSTTNT